MNNDTELEKKIRANGKIYKRLNTEIIKVELDTDHYYYLPDIGWVPSVTSILDEAAPVGFGLRNFWKQNSAEESDQIFKQAGEFGSKIHVACEQLLNGETLNLLEHYPTIPEKKSIVAFGKWFGTVNPKSYDSEQVVASTKYVFAGTLDFLGQITRANAVQALGLTKTATEAFINGEPDKLETWLIDIKTSKYLHYSHELQVAAYKQAVYESLGITVDRTGLLRIPSLHKIGFEFKETKRTVDDYMNVYRTYKDIHNGTIPYPKEIVVYPTTYKLLQEIK